jgi:excisionase family DNA binding protein
MNELLKISEVAKHLKVGDGTVRRWIKKGLLEGVELPRRGKKQGYRVRLDTIEKIVRGEQ